MKCVYEKDKTEELRQGQVVRLEGKARTLLYLKSEMVPIICMKRLTTLLILYNAYYPNK